MNSALTQMASRVSRNTVSAPTNAFGKFRAQSLGKASLFQKRNGQTITKKLNRAWGFTGAHIVEMESHDQQPNNLAGAA